MPFTIVRQDITKMRVDAIVNAANTALQMGGGVCGAIFKAAGAAELQAACDKLAPIKAGEAIITPGFRLPAKFVIHTAGPAYRGGTDGEELQLRACYKSCLRLAMEHGCRSVAFPLISSGIYGYPKDQALRVATDTIQEFLEEHEIDVFLVVFDKAAVEVSEKLLGEVESYIDEHYVEQHWDKRREYRLLDVEKNALNAPPKMMSYAQDAAAPLELDELAGNFDELAGNLDELVGNLDEPFSEMLLRLIDKKGKTDVEVYKRANLDRKLFSKIRTGRGYTPSKRTAIALAVALELSLKETDDLLKRAGYALSHSQKFDVIVEYFIISGKYSILEINEVLFKYDQPLLGG